jgi:hypothetical protein
MEDVQKPREDFASAFEAAFARLQVALLEACRSQRDWPAKAGAGIAAGMEFAAADPAAAAVLTNEALAEGADGIARHERLIAYLGERLLPGREEWAEDELLPEITERAMAGAVLTLIAQRVDQGRASELPGLAPEAIRFVLTPYLGMDAARRIATQFCPGDPDAGLS